MIKSVEEKEIRGIEIDLTGSEGNAFVLLGYASRFADQLGWSKQQKKAMLDEMKSSGYKHLVAIFDHYFGNFVTLYT